MIARYVLPTLIAFVASPAAASAQALEHAAAPRSALPARAAESNVLERQADLVVRGAALSEALNMLSQRAQVPIAFSASLLPDGSHRVDCACRNVTVGAALGRLLAGTNLTFRELHQQVVIHPLPALRGLPSAPSAASDVLFLEASMTTGGSPAPRAREVLGTIRGSVVETGTRRPLSGAQIVLVGTPRSAVTNDAGEYVMPGVPDGNYQLRASMVGYQPVERAVVVETDRVVSVHFELRSVAVYLDEIVVTGTAEPVTRRRLGNSITTIDAATVVERANNTTVAELLQSNAPGVTVLESSGVPGAAGTIRIRGVTSLAGTSEPVVYVDGVRIHSGAGASFRNNWENANENQRYPGGGQTASALDAINPEDVESIEIIKGPAAATLYGAEAANGVIQIITRRGRVGDQQLQWRLRTQFGSSGWGLDTRANRTTCDAVRLADPVEWPGCAGQPLGTILTENFLSGAVHSGAVRNLSLALNGGGRGHSFYASVDNDLEEGVFSNSAIERTSARANFSFQPSERVDFAVSIGFAHGETRFPMTDNGPNVLEAAWTYQPGRAPQPGQTYGYAGGTPEQYEIYDNRLTGDRLTIGTTLNWRPFSWFRHRLTVGGDVNSRQANRYIAPNSLFNPVLGQMTQGAPRNNVYTVEYAGAADHRLPILGRLPATFSFGMQYTDQQFRNTIAQGTGYATDLVRNVGSATTRHSWDEFSMVRTLGFYGQEQIAWRDRLYLTAALRVDNSSVFGENIQQIYYPKLSASWIVSEEDFFFSNVRWLDNLKLRAAWGQAGNAPNAFAKVTTYGIFQTIDPDSGTVVSGVRLLTLGNPDVRPERGTEIELGFDAALLGNRLGLEFTFYNKTTRDALMQVPLSPSGAGISGGTQLRNLGEINNRGLELAIVASPIRRPNISWDTRLGIFTNRNRLVDFGFQTAPIMIGVTTLNQQHAEGYPLAGYWVHDPVPNGTGGFDPSPARFLGPSMPTREASFSNTVTLFGNLRAHALIDYKGGHYLLNMTDHRRCVAQLCEEVNDPNTTAQRRAELQASLGANDALYTQRADFIKLRELSLTYTLPTTFSRRLRANRVALTLTGHNLGYLWKPYYKGLDPEVTFNGINQPGGDGQTFGWVRMDYWTVPMLRRVAFAVDVSF